MIIVLVNILIRVVVHFFIDMHRMIYNIKTKTMIVTPPKCGTTILHHVLCTFPNFWYVLGPTKWDTTSKHCSANDIKTNEIIIDRWVLLIRHPVARMISMWKHQRTYDKYEGSLADFINNRDLTDGWYAPCTDYCDNPNAVLRQENLYDDCVRVLGLQLGGLRSDRMNDSKFSYSPIARETELLHQAASTVYASDMKVGQYEI